MLQWVTDDWRLLLVGVEPPTFWMWVERANQITARHREAHGVYYYYFTTPRETFLVIDWKSSGALSVSWKLSKRLLEMWIHTKIFLFQQFIPFWNFLKLGGLAMGFEPTHQFWKRFSSPWARYDGGLLTVHLSARVLICVLILLQSDWLTSQRVFWFARNLIGGQALNDLYKARSILIIHLLFSRPIQYGNVDVGSSSCRGRSPALDDTAK